MPVRVMCFLQRRSLEKNYGRARVKKNTDIFFSCDGRDRKIGEEEGSGQWQPAGQATAACGGEAAATRRRSSSVGGLRAAGASRRRAQGSGRAVAACGAARRRSACLPSVGTRAASPRLRAKCWAKEGLKWAAGWTASQAEAQIFTI